MKFADVLEIKNGRNQRQVENPDGRYPIYGSGGVMGRADDYICEAETVVIGRKGSINNPIFVNEPFWNVDTAFGLIAKRDVLLPKYLYYFCVNFDFEKLNTTVTIPSLTKANLLQIEIALPTLEEQKKVVDVLDKVTNLVELRQQQLVKLDELAKARFVEMFGDESNPFRWPIVAVKDIAYVQVGVVIKPAQYYTDKEHGTRTFRSLNIGPMYVKDADWVYFSEEGNRKNQKSILKENDLLVVRSGAPGTACVVTEEYAGCNAVDVIIAHPDLTKVNPFFLCAYTNLPHGKKQIDEGVGGAAQQHFNVGKYNKMRIILPPLEMQKKYKMFLEQVNKSKLSIKKSLEQVETLKKSLMQKYFG